MKTSNPNLIYASNVTFLYAILNVMDYLIDHLFIRKWFTIESIERDGIWVAIIIGIGFLIRNGFTWIKYYLIICLLNNLFWIIFDLTHTLPPPNELVFGINKYYTTIQVFDFLMQLYIIILLFWCKKNVNPFYKYVNRSKPCQIDKSG